MSASTEIFFAFLFFRLLFAHVLLISLFSPFPPSRRFTVLGLRDLPALFISFRRSLCVSLLSSLRSHLACSFSLRSPALRIHVRFPLSRTVLSFARFSPLVLVAFSPLSPALPFYLIPLCVLSIFPSICLPSSPLSISLPVLPIPSCSAFLLVSLPDPSQHPLSAVSLSCALVPQVPFDFLFVLCLSFTFAMGRGGWDAATAAAVTTTRGRLV